MPILPSAPLLRLEPLDRVEAVRVEPATAILKGHDVAAADRKFKPPVRTQPAHDTGSPNRPYVEPKLRGCMVCLANRTASRFLRRAPAVARPPDQRAAPPTNRPRCRALDPGQAGPYRLPHPATESRLIVLFTAAWIVPAAPAPRAAARSDTAPALHAPGATVSSL
jgi:hypothetical protein